MKSLSIAICVLLCFVRAQGQYDFDGELASYYENVVGISDETVPQLTAFNETVALGTNECFAVSVTLPPRVDAETIVTIKKLPKNCSTASLRYTNSLLESGKCLEASLVSRGSCVVPGNGGLTSKDQLCDNFGPGTINATARRQTFKRTQCSEREFFFAMQSSCQEPITVNIKVKTTDIGNRFCFSSLPTPILVTDAPDIPLEEVEDEPNFLQRVATGFVNFFKNLFGL